MALVILSLCSGVFASLVPQDLEAATQGGEQEWELVSHEAGGNNPDPDLVPQMEDVDVRAPFHVLWMRHGESEWNRAVEESKTKLLTESLGTKYVDSPLTVDGIQDAMRVCQQLYARISSTERLDEKLRDVRQRPRSPNDGLQGLALAALIKILDIKQLPGARQPIANEWVLGLDEEESLDLVLRAPLFTLSSGWQKQRRCAPHPTPGWPWRPQRPSAIGPEARLRSLRLQHPGPIYSARSSPSLSGCSCCASHTLVR